MNETPQQAASDLDENEVLSYLRAHPHFLQNHPDLLLAMAPPRQELGSNVEDFQHHLLGRLQESLKGMKERYEGLIVASRDNMSTQHQVHQAVLGLVKAPDLHALLQMLTQDLLRLFDVDVVRLALESPIAPPYEAQYGEQNYSGVTFLTPGLAEAALGGEPSCRLVARLAETMDEPLRQIFAECAGLIGSCALLKLELPDSQREAVLAFGVRHEGRFTPHQGVELLEFLARIVEYKLDLCLRRESGEEW